MLQHPNEVLLRDLFATFVRGDREGAARFFAEDAVFHYPAPGALHGEHRGREAIRRFWDEQDRCSGDAFQPQLLDLAASERNVFLLVRIGAGLHRVVVYEFADGVIVEARVFEDDPEAAIAFFSRGSADA